MRKRTAKTLCIWFATLPLSQQTEIMYDALRRRHRDENNSRRRGERPDKEAVGERQVATFFEVIASKRALLDNRQKNKDVPKIEKLISELAFNRQPRRAKKTEFIAEHLTEIIQLQNRGLSIRKLQKYLADKYKISVSIGILHTALKELNPDTETPS